jgi:hypothetical protein
MEGQDRQVKALLCHDADPPKILPRQYRLEFHEEEAYKMI